MGASAAITFSSGGTHLNVTQQAFNIIPLRVTVNSGSTSNILEIYASGGFAGGFGPTGVLYCSYSTGAGTNTLINADIPDTTMQRSVIIGQGAYSSSGQIGELVAIGYGTGANRYGVAIGQSANAGGVTSIAIGLQASVTGGGSAVGIGYLANIAHTNAMGFGSRATSAAAGDIVFATEQQNATIRIQTMSTNTGIVSYLGAIANTWINNTDATKTSRLRFSTYYTTSAQEAFRIDSASDQARTAIGGDILSGSRLSIYTGLATDRGLVVQGATSQTANLQEWQNSAGAVYARVNASGEFFGLLSSGLVTSGAIASGQVGNNHLTSTISNKVIEGDIQTINAQTGTTYTLALSDAGKLVTLNNGASIAVTIPLNSSVAFATGTHVDFAQLGAGQVTINGAVGVTLNYTPGNKLRAQYAGASIIKIATDTWMLFGDISA
jgi:hypothetical protein